MPKNDKNNNDLGFGHFSTAETEKDWLLRHYDGLESTADLEKILKLEKENTS